MNQQYRIYVNEKFICQNSKQYIGGSNYGDIKGTFDESGKITWTKNWNEEHSKWLENALQTILKNGISGQTSFIDVNRKSYKEHDSQGFPVGREKYYN